MATTCPGCNDANVQLLSAAYGGGASSAAAADSSGVAVGTGRGDPAKVTSRRTAPPAKASYVRILLFWVIATFAAPFLVLMLQLPEGAEKWVPYGISIVTAYALLRAYSYNKTQWPALFEGWQHSYICLHCGKIFKG